MKENRKIAVVTGSTKGIGRAIVLKYLKEGYSVIANYSHDDDAAEILKQAAKKYLVGENTSLTVIKEDLSAYQGAVNFSEKIKRIAHTIDILVLNCGATDRSAFENITRESWERIMNINLNVPFYLLQELNTFISPNEGRIIFIGSVMGIYPHSTSLAYGVTKAAIHQMAKELVKVFANRNITVNAIAPGFVETPRQTQKTLEQKQRIENKIALKRFGVPEEISNICWFLTKNQYINGSVIVADGGYCYF